MAPSVERKLTTIFSADAAGYSRLMADDERATFDTQRRRGQTSRLAPAFCR